ncbi:MAG TPA: hypothetical protein PLW93_02690 [Candidatus Absconditabacterales bacterium]|nr:hypothetical protein [Candidatus Absconditabacterales bacterium]
MTKEIKATGVVEKFHKDYIKDAIDAKVRAEGGDGIEAVVAGGFATLLNRGKSSTLDESDTIFLRTLQTLGNIYGRMEKEKKVIHTLDMPRLTNDNIDKF